jgi:hypothetical protein
MHDAVPIDQGHTIDLFSSHDCSFPSTFDRGPSTHFTNEDVDQPQTAGETSHDHVADEIPKTITFAFHDNHVHDTSSQNKKRSGGQPKLSGIPTDHLNRWAIHSIIVHVFSANSKPTSFAFFRPGVRDDANALPMPGLGMPPSYVTIMSLGVGRTVENFLITIGADGGSPSESFVVLTPPGYYLARRSSRIKWSEGHITSLKYGGP